MLMLKPHEVLRAQQVIGGTYSALRQLPTLGCLICFHC
jgi:hypothetical protein